MKTFHGHCHCGKIAFTVEGELEGVLSCNCSYCAPLGSLLWFVPQAQVKSFIGKDLATVYTFNTHTIEHHFCPTCGIHPFSTAIHPQTKVPTLAVNTRCLDNVDVSQLKITHYDGRAI